MAQQWIKIRTNIHEDPKVISIASGLGLSEDEVVGKLLRFWSWADRHLLSGDAPTVTTSWVDRHVSTAGFAAAMIKAGWLLETDNGIAIPQFERHLGKRAKQRALTAKRMVAYRNGSDDSVTLGASPKRNESLESADLLDEIARHLNLGYAKAGRVVHEVGVGPEDWRAWLAYETEQGTALTVQNIQRYRHPEEIPKPVKAQQRSEWLESRRRSSFAKPGKFEKKD